MRPIHRQLLRFARMGLRGNPFRVVEPFELARLYVVVSGRAADEIVRSRHPITQIMAPRGRGKTTLLHAVGAKLSELEHPYQYIYFPPDRRIRFVAPAAETRVLLLDEAQRMHRGARRHARRWQKAGGGRIVAATHEDLAGVLGAYIPTIRLPPADAGLITRMFERRIVWADGDPHRIQLPQAAARWLAEHAEGSLRRVEEICYEVFQLAEPGEEIVIDVRLLQQAELQLAQGSGSTA